MHTRAVNKETEHLK